VPVKAPISKRIIMADDVELILLLIALKIFFHLLP
jgi:hypothetical protein